VGGMMPTRSGGMGGGAGAGDRRLCAGGQASVRLSCKINGQLGDPEPSLVRGGLGLTPRSERSNSKLRERRKEKGPWIRSLSGEGGKISEQRKQTVLLLDDR